MKRSAVILFVFTALAFNAGSSATTFDEVQVHQLSNGLTVLTLEDHFSPLVATTVMYHVGIKDEPRGQSGITAICAWLVNEGTTAYPRREYSRIIQSGGGSNDYEYYYDVTNFTVRAPAVLLDTILFLESERMRNLEFSFEKLMLAKDAARRNRLAKVENSIYGHINEEFFNLAYRSHPYRNSLFGWVDDIKGISFDDAKKYYRAYFQPSNAVLVVLGDFETETVMARIKELFGDIYSPPKPKKRTVIEPKQIGARYSYITGESGVPVILIGYHAPCITDDDFPMIRLIYRLLAQGGSSRMPARLVETEQTALACGGGYMLSEDPSLTYYWSILNYDADLKESEKQMLEEIERIKTEAVTDDELERAKNQIEVDFYLHLQTLREKANDLGLYHFIAGDWRFINGLVERTRNITKDDIQRVARNYLVESNRTVVILKPPESEEIREEDGK
jgi:predicted Zn-dependent peptidase